MAITLLLVDNHKLLREAWTAILNSDERFLVVGETDNAGEAYRIVKEKAPIVALVDIMMSPVDGFEITRKILEISPTTKVIAVSIHNSADHAKKMMRTGAKGYVTKNSPRDELITAIIEVNKGNRFICEEMKDILAAQQLEEGPGVNLQSKLTKTELQIMNILRTGLSSKEIALQMDVSVKTIEVHRFNILKKLKVKNTAALINYMNTMGM